MQLVLTLEGCELVAFSLYSFFWKSDIFNKDIVSISSCTSNDSFGEWYFLRLFTFATQFSKNENFLTVRHCQTFKQSLTQTSDFWSEITKNYKVYEIFFLILIINSNNQSLVFTRKSKFWQLRKVCKWKIVQTKMRFLFV